MKQKDGITVIVAGRGGAETGVAVAEHVDQVGRDHRGVAGRDAAGIVERLGGGGLTGELRQRGWNPARCRSGCRAPSGCVCRRNRCCNPCVATWPDCPASGRVEEQLEKLRPLIGAAERIVARGILLHETEHVGAGADVQRVDVGDVLAALELHGGPSSQRTWTMPCGDRCSLGTVRVTWSWRCDLCGLPS